MPYVANGSLCPDSGVTENESSSMTFSRSSRVVPAAAHAAG